MIHVISRPRTAVSRVPSVAVRNVVSSLRSAGVQAIRDVRSVDDGDLHHEVAACTAELSQQWAEQLPEVVHAFGVVATAAALVASEGRVPVVATFDERPADDALEEDLARQVDGVLPLSMAERRRWHAAGARTIPSGVLGLPVRIADPDACAVEEGGHVATFATGRTLDVLLDSMRLWGQDRLVVLSPLTAARRAEVLDLAASLGVLDRVVLRPGLRGADRERMWAQTALLASGTDGARHAAHVLEAAAHGVPAVAVARDAHLDHVVPGATGLLVDVAAGSGGLARAITTLLQDPLSLRGYGAAALVRVRSMYEPETVGRRLLAQYESLLGTGGDEPDEAAAVTGDLRLPPEREQLVLEHLPLAHQLARRYARRGQPLEDLVQVASLGLVKAAQRFDPDAGNELAVYAVPTILGELRRYFRDHSWAVRVPRAMQETTLQVQRAADRLQQTPGSESQTTLIAEELGIAEDDVLQARRARAEAWASQSLDLPLGAEGDETLGGLLGTDDPGLARIEEREALRSALAQLPAREREILVLRFFGDRTQGEIAEILGMSQVHVSRLLSRTLATLRDHVLHEQPLPAVWTAPARLAS